jgi:hypothetical protein
MKNSTTSRRFKNFEVLHSRLQAECPHTLLPHLPEEPENRTENLQNYLKKLMTVQVSNKQGKLSLPQAFVEFISNNSEVVYAY